MKERTIKLSNSAETSKLVELAEKVKGHIDILTSDGVKLDASSILGIFAVKHGSAMSISYPETADEFDDFLTSLEIKATALQST